jgi:hypothetical protein
MCRPLYCDERSVTVDYFSKMTGACHFHDTTTLPDIPIPESAGHKKTGAWHRFCLP